MENNLAYIDFGKCKLCRKCAPVCPTEAIHEINFPPRKEKEAEITGKTNGEITETATVKPVAKQDKSPEEPAENSN